MNTDPRSESEHAEWALFHVLGMDCRECEAAEGWAKLDGRDHGHGCLRQSNFNDEACWRDLGVTEEGERVADALVGDLTRWFKKCPPELITEARFRARELPKRMLDYRKRYEKENGMAHDG